MQNELFSRNWLFLNETLQKKVSKTKVMLCGTGMGSQVLITLVRLGFENFIISDGDTVSLSNLNRQHFFKKDIDQNKAESILKYAKEINSNIKVKLISKFLEKKDLEKWIPKCDFIINCIDLDSKAFIDCHTICKKNKKIEIFPVNLGFGTGVLVSSQKTPSFNSFFGKNKDEMKGKLLNHMINHKESSLFLKEKFNEYKKTKSNYDPQNIISTLITSSVISILMLNILDNKDVKLFPLVNYLEFK